MSINFWTKQQDKIIEQKSYDRSIFACVYDVENNKNIIEKITNVFSVRIFKNVKNIVITPIVKTKNRYTEYKSYTLDKSYDLDGEEMKKKFIRHLNKKNGTNGYYLSIEILFLHEGVEITQIIECKYINRKWKSFFSGGDQKLLYIGIYNDIIKKNDRSYETTKIKISKWQGL